MCQTQSMSECHVCGVNITHSVAVLLQQFKHEVTYFITN